MLETLREEVAATARALAAAELVRDASGNVSARAGDAIAVTRTGAALREATAADVSVVDRAGRLLQGGPPSSELLVHLAIYASFAAGAVVHSHAPAATAAAEQAGVPVAPWAPEGSRALADHVVEALTGGADTVVMEGHGTVAHAPTLREALERTIALEDSCASSARR